MVSLLPAEHYRHGRDIGSIAPGRAADILLMKSLDAFPPEKVIVNGRIVAECGHLKVEVRKPDFPEFYRRSINLEKVDWTQVVLKAPIQSGAVAVRVIEARDAEAKNRVQVETVSVESGAVFTDPSRDILKIIMVERYGRHGKIGVGLVRGFGLKRGAMAASVSIPSNNIVAVGVTDADLRLAVERVAEIQGGYVVVEDGKVLGEVRLNLGGVMSDQPFEDVVQEIEAAQVMARKLGSGLVHTMFTMAQTVLSTLPELGLTDQGLVNARTAEIVSIFVQEGVL